MKKTIEKENILDLMRTLGFKEEWLSDKSGRWHELKFKFDDVPFEFVIDIDEMTFHIGMGGSCSEVLLERELNMLNFTQTLQKWELI